jgi:hypothetical protein
LLGLAWENYRVLLQAYLDERAVREVRADMVVGPSPASACAG